MTTQKPEKPKRSELEVITLLTFRDGPEEFSRSYRGVPPLVEGDIVNLLDCGDKMRVAPGNYVVRRAPTIPLQMGFALAQYRGAPTTDVLHRYFICEKVSDNR